MGRAIMSAMTTAFWVKSASVLMFLTVALGAFGAHALKGRLDEAARAIFETAVRYQAYHALALFAVAWYSHAITTTRVPLRRASVSQCPSGIFVVIQFMPQSVRRSACSAFTRSQSSVCWPVTRGCPGGRSVCHAYESQPRAPYAFDASTPRMDESRSASEFAIKDFDVFAFHDIDEDLQVVGADLVPESA